MLQVVAGLRDQGIAASVDCFGELVADPAAAERATADYVQLATTLAQVQDAWLAIDLSHIGLDVSVDACRRHLAAIVEALPAGRRMQVGAEDTSRTDPILQVVTALAAPGGAADGDRAGQPAPQPPRSRPAGRGRRAGPAVQGGLCGASGTGRSVG
jgi:proline dehydrogenase